MPGAAMPARPLQTDLEADCQAANTLAELIIGGSLTSFEITREDQAAAVDGCVRETA